MSENIKAFPNPYGVPVPQEGMDLRDWFAGQALVGFSLNANPAIYKRDIGKICYDVADSMMEARKK